MKFPPTLSASAPLDRLSILVLEDHDDLLAALAMLLRGLGMHVFMSQSVAEAVRLLGKANPRLILSDLHLPDGSGCDFIEQVRTDRRRDADALPAVAMSGRAEPELRQRALASGFQAFISKPFDFDLLVVKFVDLVAARCSTSPGGNGVAHLAQRVLAAPIVSVAPVLRLFPKVPQ